MLSSEGSFYSNPIRYDFSNFSSDIKFQCVYYCNNIFWNWKNNVDWSKENNIVKWNLELFKIFVTHIIFYLNFKKESW